MFKIVEKKWLNDKICFMKVEAPLIAKSAKPGQFLIVKIDEYGERIPLTISDFDREAGTISIVFFVIGESTEEMGKLEVGECFADVVGPLGRESEFLHLEKDRVKMERYLFIAGGVGVAPIYPQVKWFRENGIDVDVIIGAKNKEMLIYEEEIKEIAKNLYITTDDGSYGEKGLVTDMLDKLIGSGKKYDHIVAIGPMVMMKYVSLKSEGYGIPVTVSLNPLMVDGTGMCGACRVTVGGEVKFACVDGPEFDGKLVDFDESIKRQQIYKTEEGREYLKRIEGDTHHSPIPCGCHEEFDRKKRIKVREQSPAERIKNFDEVTLNYSLEEAKLEASRCLDCKNPLCVQGCPVSINIPEFIREIKKGDIEEAGRVIRKYTNLPSICGRVCPQETQCEAKCIVGIKGEAVSIGKLEKFVGDYLLENNIGYKKGERNGGKVAVVGSGPAGLTVAGDLSKLGYEVTIFEALHEFGGVLTYGIPEFRLPKERIVKKEILNLKSLGVQFEKDIVVGKSLSVDELLDKYDAVFIGSGAGLPKFMGIKGENLNGVMSANEFLTRVNLMKSCKNGYKTPIKIPKKVAVIGGGNVAMDAVRTAKRLGAESHIVYRRGIKEFPAREEEREHAIQEGVIVDELTLPKEILGDDEGNVTGMRCIRTKLGEKDESGRAKFIEIEGSEFIMEVDTVIVAIGTSPNPLIVKSTKNLSVNRWGCIEVDSDGRTSREGVFAGGDVASGAATVILAMEAGKKAVIAIDNYIKSKK